MDLARIIRCETLRREMLWLRAMEKGDIAAARLLEEVDPNLRGRLADVVEEAKGCDTHGAARVFGRAFDAKLVRGPRR